jgi:predicted porin
MLANHLARLALVAAMTASAGIQAAEWSLDPEISARLRYDDNFRLATRNELSVWETALLPKLTFARTTETSRLAGSAGLSLRRFDEDGLDSNDRFLRFQSSRASERSNWGLNADYTRDSSLDSELVDDQVFFDRVPRERWSITPTWSHALNETTSLNASYQFVDVSYPDIRDNPQYTGYQFHTASLGAGYALTPVTRLVAQLGLSRSERDDDTQRSDNRQLTLGVEHRFSERLSGSASAGSSRTETDYKQGFLACSGVILPGFFFGVGGSVCVDPDTLIPIPFDVETGTTTAKSSNTVYNAELRYQLETGDLTLRGSRSTTPYTNGGMVQNERISLAGRHRFSSRLQASLSLDWYRTQNTDDFSARTDRTTTSVRPSLQWKLDRDWSLSAGYRYFRQEYEGSIQSATSNAVDLTLSYNWPRMAVSR